MTPIRSWQDIASRTRSLRRLFLQPPNPYATSKLICEEAGRAFSAESGISFIALRIGNIGPGENIPHPGMGMGLWGQQMWLSNRDFVDAVQAAIDVREVPFAILNLVSNNSGMRWDLTETRQVLGFFPKDGFACQAALEDVAKTTWRVSRA